MTEPLPPSPLRARVIWPVWFASHDRSWAVYRRLVSRPLEWLRDLTDRSPSGDTLLWPGEANGPDVAVDRG